MAGPLLAADTTNKGRVAGRVGDGGGGGRGGRGPAACCPLTRRGLLLQ